jgi:hypothetical protein
MTYVYCVEEVLLSSCGGGERIPIPAFDLLFDRMCSRYEKFTILIENGGSLIRS